ncbi:FGGY-family carbohydrate kinase [Taklimakanibacter lacteus]|uniref:FGGY-family carbohydrate kinase n=1 Tax=Taklimakanibacter lacteus TaxID=2268456 RepID=UPI000E672C79
MTPIAVFDIGKTNVKLSSVTADGELLETLSAPNLVQDGPPYRHHDLARLEAWLIGGLSELAARHEIGAIVTCAHGSGGVLVGPDGPVLPMMDYEQSLPSDIVDAYRAAAGPYRERGSPIMLGASHLARQMLWQETRWPRDFARATHFLTTPQYWAWRLSGVAACEVTSLAAQSHLWAAVDNRPARIVAERRWQKLLPPLRPAWTALGSLKPSLAQVTKLSPATRVLNGIHDSSANFYRYQAAGLSDFTVVSTGTWIVLLTDRTGVDFDDERPGHTVNADIRGRPLPGMLSMGGREFSAVAKDSAGPASAHELERLLASRTLALPSFGSDDGLFPGSARQGRIEGPLANDMSARFTLAVLYAALLTAECIERLPASASIVLDGNFVSDPLYGALVARLLPRKHVLVSRSTSGTASGAALLAGHETRQAPAPLSAEVPDISALPDLSPYRARWRALTTRMEHVP